MNVIAIDGEQLVRMAEMIEAGAGVEELIAEFPNASVQQITDLVEGWDE